MSTNAGRYQAQISGRSADHAYHLDGRSFDGHEPGVNGKPDTLVEAKYLEDNGRFAKGYENMKQGNFSDFEHLYDRAMSMLDQAKAQVSAADGTGMQIEWRVSGEKATEALKTLFDNDRMLQSKINVEHVPSRPEPVPAGAPKVDQAPVGAPKPTERATRFGPNQTGQRSSGPQAPGPDSQTGHPATPENGATTPTHRSPGWQRLRSSLVDRYGVELGLCRRASALAQSVASCRSTVRWSSGGRRREPLRLGVGDRCLAVVPPVRSSSVLRNSMPSVARRPVLASSAVRDTRQRRPE